MLESLKQFIDTAKEQYGAAKSGLGPLRLSKYGVFRLLIRKISYDLILLLSDLREDFQAMSLQKQILITSTTILIMTVILGHLMSNTDSLARRRGIPVLQRPKGVHRWDYQTLLREGANQYPYTPYIIAYSGYEYVVYPSTCFDDVKRLPAATASMIEWFTSVYFQGWRFLGRDNSALHKMIAVDLTRAVSSRTRERQDQARKAFDETLRPVDGNWKAIPLSSTLMDIVTRTNATSLVGAELGMDSRWLNAVKRFPIAIMLPVFICHAVPRIIRPVVSLLAFAPAWGLYWYMKILLRPVVKQDLERMAKEQETTSMSTQSKFQLTSWLMSRYRPEERSVGQLTHDYIVASFESTPSTAGTLYFILAELVTRPELLDELREELVGTVNKDGYLPPTHVSVLPKMDSVMSESSRMNMFSYLTLFRKILKPVQLSTGPLLPPGSLICVDANQLTTSSSRWEDPDIFDPQRFLKLRKQPGHETLHQFTSLGPDTPGWGDGLQACPGRTFAASTIKIVLTHLLLNYDIQLPPGAQKPKRNSMPNGSMSPDMSAKILIRARNN